MNEPVDLSKIKDVVLLRSMAYEQVLALETAQANLRALQIRIAELEKK